MSMGVGYVDGRAHRLSSTEVSRPIFDVEEWQIISTDVTLAHSDHDPGVWIGLESLEACPQVGGTCTWELYDRARVFRLGHGF